MIPMKTRKGINNYLEKIGEIIEVINISILNIRGIYSQ